MKLQTVAGWLMGAATVACYFCGSLISPGFYPPAVILTGVGIVCLLFAILDEPDRP